MKDPKNLTISLLCVSAAILASILIVLYTNTPAPAASPARGGDYIMITGSVTNSLDLLYIFDLAALRVNTYVFNPIKDELILKDQTKLTLVFRPTAGAAER
jgi:hypothetical protein